MSKILVMENYVDECLDEVEIRGLYITEGVMDTPTMSIIKKLENLVRRDKGKISDLQTKIMNSKDANLKTKAFADMQKVKGSMAWNIRVIENIKSDPNRGILADIPYLYQIIGATLIVAALAYTAYKLYKRFMSKAAKSCQDKSGKMKTICMNQYQIKGLELTKKPFMTGLKGCSKSKDVQICKAKFNKKINQINKKIEKKKNKIKKLMSK